MIIVCSGLIGAGKSTLCNRLCESLDGVPFHEPVDDNPYLELFYQNPKEYGFSMQIKLLKKRLDLYKDAMSASAKGRYAICDRSIYEDWAFAYVNYECGNIKKIDMQTYNEWHTDFTGRHVPYPDLILNLKCGIDTLIKRIGERNRECEQNGAVPPEYLAALGHAYEICFKKLSKHTRIVDIDAEQDADGVLHDALDAVFRRISEITEGDADFGDFSPVYHGGF